MTLTEMNEQMIMLRCIIEERDRLLRAIQNLGYEDDFKESVRQFKDALNGAVLDCIDATTKRLNNGEE